MWYKLSDRYSPEPPRWPGQGHRYGSPRPDTSLEGLVHGVLVASSIVHGRIIHPVPVNADVPALEVHFVDEVDAPASAIGAKGIGELGAAGGGPAMVSAIRRATGIRLRDVPIRPERLIQTTSRQE